MVRVELEYERARPILESIVAYGIGRWIENEWQIRFGRRALGAGAFGSIPILALAGATQVVTDIPYEQDVKNIGIGVALASLDDLIRVYVLNEPIATFTDPSTIIVWNLEAFSADPTKWAVLVDGAEVSVSKAEGDQGKAELHLAQAVTRGSHDVVITVTGARKAFSGRLVV